MIFQLGYRGTMKKLLKHIFYCFLFLIIPLIFLTNKIKLAVLSQEKRIIHLVSKYGALTNTRVLLFWQGRHSVSKRDIFMWCLNLLFKELSFKLDIWDKRNTEIRKINVFSKNFDFYQVIDVSTHIYSILCVDNKNLEVYVLTHSLNLYYDKYETPQLDKFFSDFLKKERINNTDEIKELAILYNSIKYQANADFFISFVFQSFYGFNILLPLFDKLNKDNFSLEKLKVDKLYKFLENRKDLFRVKLEKLEDGYLIILYMVRIRDGVCKVEKIVTEIKKYKISSYSSIVDVFIVK